MKRWQGPVVAYIDVLWTLFVVSIAFMAPPVPPTQAMADKPICQMAVDAVWQGDLPVDVDLWVRAPGDTPVGYSAKDGKSFNLVRDDLGTATDSLGINSERACASGLPDGEYTVNLHLYNHAVPPPISVGVVVSSVDAYRAEMSEVVKREVVLTTKGQELTVVRFTLKDGKLVAGSEHDIPVKMRHGSNDPGARP
jgi:hypothetical protein